MVEEARSQIEAPPVMAAGRTPASIVDQIDDLVLARHTTKGWYLGFAVAFLFVMLLLVAITYLFAVGVGIWGIAIPVAWGFAITNFVWWIGIGHAGTLISAFLLLARQPWRASINRIAEAMTLFAVLCAALFPLLHLGRPWFFYWLIPYPTNFEVWPQFRSPLVWDFFAVLTYATVSLVFWYIGMVPDLASLRDRTSHKSLRLAYGFFALGWRGSARHWSRYEHAYLLLAVLATPLVVSVHSIVSFDFAVAIVPGWHHTIFPPYFVAGALYTGIAMVLLIAIPLRAIYHLDDLVTPRHIEALAKLLLATGLVVGYSYVVEWFMAWYGGGFDLAQEQFRILGAYAPVYWALIAMNVLTVQVLWFTRLRSNIPVLLIVSSVVLIGMWIERFIIVVASLSSDFLPSAQGVFVPTGWDWATLAGTVGLFIALFYLFTRFLPMIAAAETARLAHEQSEGEQP
jgi:molybdopterin-containing oxidoreductase family membrane subunit